MKRTLPKEVLETPTNANFWHDNCGKDCRCDGGGHSGGGGGCTVQFLCGPGFFGISVIRERFYSAAHMASSMCVLQVTQS